jgi:3-oxoacyl-[acyl-carrier protein] reductase
MQLKNKTALITGASRGLGKAIAIEFAKQGAKVILTDTDIDACEDACDEIKDLGFDALAIECDVTKTNDVKKLVKKTLKTFQKIDILVNAVSEDIIKPFLEMTQKEWDAVITTNLRGSFLPSQEVAKYMVQEKKGIILFISSIAGKIGFTYASAFSTAKAGIINLTKDLALELAEHKIRVNCVVSGVLPTKMQSEIVGDKKTKKELLNQLLLNRIGTPEDIAKTAVFLASEQSLYITGQNIIVDGGWTSR